MNIMDMLAPPTGTSWFTDLGMEEPMLDQQDYVREFLADTPNIAEDMVDMDIMEDDFFVFDSGQSLSSLLKCNSAAAADATTPAVISQHYDHKSDTKSQSPNSRPVEIISFGTHKSSSSSSSRTVNADPTRKSPTRDEIPSLEVDPYRGDRDNKHHRTVLKTGRRREHYDHIIAERQRRQNLTKCFIALSALIPGLKKMDKASILIEAIKHMKELKLRLKKFEEAYDSQRSESDQSAIPVKRSRALTTENVTRLSRSSSSLKHEKYVLATTCTDEQRLEIEAQFIEKHVVMKVFCKKQKGVLMKIIAHIEDLHLSVITTNAIPFQDSNFDITIVAKVESEFDMRPHNVVKSLYTVFQ